MSPYRKFLLSLLASSFFVPALHAADKAQLATRLKSAAELSSLDSDGLRPWHMGLEITLYDIDGKNAKPATIEIWKADNDMKIVESVDGVQVTTVRNNGKLFRTTAQAPEFVTLELLAEQVLHPIPDELLQPGVELTEDKPSAAKVPLDCISPSLPAPSTSVVSIGRQLSFCLKRDTESLLVSYAPGDLVNFRQQTGTFQSKEVTVDLKVLFGKTLRSEAKISKLEAFAPKPDDFTPTSDMSGFAGPVEAKPTDLINSILSKTPPSYPVSARSRGAGGSVTFDSVIGSDGRVVSLQPTSNVSSDLTTAAQDAVRHWIYRPFLICGIPVPVKTTITVNFNIGS